MAPFAAAARPKPSGSAWVAVVVAGALFFVGAIVAAALVLTRSNSRPVATPIGSDPSEVAVAEGTDWSDLDASVPVSSRDPMWGSRTAPVTLVVFSDFECPFCGKFRSTIDAVKEQYGQQKLRVVWKHYPLPFHKNARPAAIAGEAVRRLGGSAAFFRFHDLAFSNQRDLNGDSYEQWAVAAGVDLEQFRSLVNDASVATKVDADIALAQTVGVKGTPNTFVNGFLVTGAQPLEKVTGIIDAEMASAERALAAGTPPDRVYVKLSKENALKNPAPTAKDKPAAAEDEEKVWDVPVGDSPARGPASAKVTIVVFSDFQCPFCARSERTMDDLREEYGTRIRIVWKNNPLAFHKQAAPAAHFALEARAQKGDAMFWAAHDLLFKNQTHLSDEDLESYATELHLDVARVRSAIRTSKHQLVIDEDKRLADKLGATGTPTFFINGHQIRGAQPIERFRARIDKELAR
ncbi:MAG: thioredoxin domain-containing protein [Polyangiaceae bacterium]